MAGTDFGVTEFNLPIFNIFGQLANVVNPGYPAYTNASHLGLAGLADTAAALTSGDATAVAIAVPQGVEISKVSVIVGNTAASTPTHQWACLYAGTGAAPARLGTQASDGTTAAIAAGGLLTFTLGAPIQITTANAPYGFIYASISVTATAVPSLATVSVAANVGYQWNSNGPLFMGALHGSALGATAPATIASPSAQAAVPIVVLT